MELSIENLSLNEANIILNALGKLPYENVFQLINKIRSGFESQLNGQSEIEIVEEE